MWIAGGPNAILSISQAAPPPIPRWVCLMASPNLSPYPNIRSIPMRSAVARVLFTGSLVDFLWIRGVRAGTATR